MVVSKASPCAHSNVEVKVNLKSWQSTLVSGETMSKYISSSASLFLFFIPSTVAVSKPHPCSHRPVFLSCLFSMTIKTGTD